LAFHSRQDAQLAGVLARTLKQRGINVLMDVDIPSGVELRRWINEAIERSNATVFLRSDKTFFTTFAGYELGYATSLGTRVIVVTLAELPPDDPFNLSDLQLIQVKPGYPVDTAAYIAQRIIESLSGDGKHQAGPS
jgi:TIR domain